MNRTLWLLGSLGLGAGLMYMLDPDRGARRRALVRQQAQSYRRWTDALLDQTRHDLEEQRRTLSRQTRGLGAQARGLGAQARGLGQQAYGFLGQLRTPFRDAAESQTTWLTHRGQTGGLQGLCMLGCVGLGVGLMYLLDPRLGRRRRALIRDKALSYWHATNARLSQTARDARNRTRGLVSEARLRFRDADVPDNRVLEARVRAQLGRVASQASAIQVDAERGQVTLRGSAPAHEVDRLLSIAASVPGVTKVVNRLAEPGRPEARSGMQDNSIVG